MSGAPAESAHGEQAGALAALFTPLTIKRLTLRNRFVMPGMRVDVLVTGHPPSQEGEMTNTVLQNLTVLSAGTQIQPDARGQPIQTPNVTLLASPEQAEVLTLANSQGRIQLVLRNSSDQQIAQTDGSHIDELYMGKHKPAPPPAQL